MTEPEISDSDHPARRRRWHTVLGIGMTVGLVAVASLTFSPSANAAVDPKAPNTRFISLANNCPPLHDREIWYKVTATTASGKVWKVWNGNITCRWTKRFIRDVFAWTPADPTYKLRIVVTDRGGDRTYYLNGDQNFCLWIHQNSTAASEYNFVNGGSSSCHP